MTLILTIENQESAPDGVPTIITLGAGGGIDIGRNTNLDWTLPDPSRFISGKHCEVRYRDGAYWLYDLSTNGTYLNHDSRRLHGPYRLQDGDRLGIGSYIIAVRIEPEAAQEGDSPPCESTPEVMFASKEALAGDQDPAAPIAAGAVFADDAVSKDGAACGDSEDAALQDAFDGPVGLMSADMPAPAARAWQSLPEPAEQVLSAPIEAEARAWREPERAPSPPVNVQNVAPEARRRDASAPSGGAGQGEIDEFLRRFAAAAGIPEQIFAGQDGLEVAAELGALMRMAVENVTQLLGARSEAERLARVSRQTMIQALDNNPLKFAPTPNDALKIMFGARTSGYLDAKRAMEGAFTDLKTHQINTFAAMQQAVRMVAEDFDPKSIDEAVGRNKGFEAFLGSRKARLWGMYLARWQALTLRHEDGLVDAFMRYFGECYDQAKEAKALARK